MRLLAFIAAAFLAVAASGCQEDSLTRSLKRASAMIEGARADSSSTAQVILQVPDDGTPQMALRRFFRTLDLYPEDEKKVAAASAVLKSRDPVLHVWAIFYRGPDCPAACNLEAAVDVLLDRYPDNVYLALHRAAPRPRYTFEDGYDLLLNALPPSPAEVAAFKESPLGREGTEGVPPEKAEALLMALRLHPPFPKHCTQADNDGKKRAKPICESPARAIVESRQPLPRPSIAFASAVLRSICKTQTCDPSLEAALQSRSQQLQANNRAHVADRLQAGAKHISASSIKGHFDVLAPLPQ